MATNWLDTVATEKQGGSKSPKRHKDDSLLPTPQYLVYDPRQPLRFRLFLNVFFALASTFTVANLYYCQPILVEVAASFNVSHKQVSHVPTLMQSGYAFGILFITPLGDLVHRRQLILILIASSTLLSVGLALSRTLLAFELLTFLVGMVSVTPQILVPLAADLAPPKRCASATSIVISGLMFGTLIARVLAGAIAEYAEWRAVYYLAIGLQALLFIGSYFTIPDYPAKNSSETYWNILRTMGTFAVSEPLLIQCCLIMLASTTCFSNFWVTLTFLLKEPPYNYSTLAIGLFGLVGMFGISLGPLIGHFIDRFVPWYATFIGILLLMCSQSIQVAAGGIHVAAVVVTCIGLNAFSQMIRLSLLAAVFSISAAARARLNAVFTLAYFTGQIIGSAAGTKIHIDYGWRASAAFAMGCSGAQLLFLLVRGPHCQRRTWYGYEGGFEAKKIAVEAE